jgi:5S rRNA maturation endonuclease (ribonuclease M5)
LSTRLRNKEEKLQQLLERLAEESAKGTPIIVEGKKDIETLKALGIDGKIISAKSGGKSFLDVISEVQRSEAPNIILLMDFDRRGREWTKRMKQHLEAARMTPNTTFWRELFSFAGKEIKDIEGLVSYLETLRKKIDNPSR